MRLAAVTCAAATLWACSPGVVSETATEGKPAPGGGQGSGKGGAGPGKVADGEEPILSRGDFVTSPGLRRLTRTEYANTINDLLGVAIIREEQPKELIVHGHGQIAGAQKTGYDDIDKFAELGQKAAALAAAKVSADFKCQDNACTRKWINDFLQRAFRAPTSTALLDRYAEIFANTSAGETLPERVTTFLTAVLTSPHFLYRKEIGTAAGSDKTLRTLDGYEVASRLSYLVWQSMPDADLMAAAASGNLATPAQRTAQLERMLKDPKAQQGLRGFVVDWMGLFETHLNKKTPDVLKDTGSDFPQVAEQAFALFVDELLFANPEASFARLFDADFAFTNATLNRIFGATGGSAQFQKVSLNTTERLGILTQPLVIGAHSKESGASPFPMGKFIYENVLCEEIPPPPAGIPTVEDNPGSDQTLRQQLEAVTAKEPCLSCHKRIGPPGFAFLPYDPVGRFKNQDASGKPYDTKGDLLLPDQAATVSFDGAADLGRKLAAANAVQKCVAKRLFRWAYGRFEAQPDTSVVRDAEKVGVENKASVAALFRQAVGSQAFSQVRVR